LRAGEAFGHPRPFDRGPRDRGGAGPLFRAPRPQQKVVLFDEPPPTSLYLDHQAIRGIRALADRAFSRPIPLVLVEEAVRTGDTRRLAACRIEVPIGYLVHFFIEALDDGRQQRHLAVRHVLSGVPSEVATRWLAAAFGFTASLGCCQNWVGELGGSERHWHVVEPLAELDELIIIEEEKAEE
jgi:hypothetical protein